RVWLEEQKAMVLPRSPTGQAVAYVLANREALVRCTEDGDLGERGRSSDAHDVVAAIDVQHFAGDGGGQRAAQEDGGVGDLLGGDRPLQRCALGGVVDHLLDVADGAGGPRGVRPGGDEVDADLLRPEVAGQLHGVDLQGGLGGGHAAAVVRHHAVAA